MRRLFLFVLLGSALLYGAPPSDEDPREIFMRTNRSRSFVTYCFYMIATDPYRMSLEDESVQNLLEYYREVDAGDLDAVMKRFARNTIYVRGREVYRGKTAVRKFFVERFKRLSGTHEIKHIAKKDNQYYVYGTFVGYNNGVPIEVDFVDFWVLDRKDKVFFRKSWISQANI